MKKILLTFICLLLIFFAWAQNSFNFNCTKDTVISCEIACITLKAQIPNISSTTDDYVVNPLSGVQAPNGCFHPYVDPGAPGTTISLLIDDKYSKAIDIGFPFSFYGITNNQLIVSTNGYLSFDISKAGTFSEWDMPFDFPNIAYDKAIIGGPYHDLDPSKLTSPTKQVKCEVIGVAPYRKWILSYYKVPMFQCKNLIENTHQIVLYESLGIIEVFIFDKQLCPNWNQGNAMIGLQNFGKNKGIMANLRKASSPDWGGLGMNESWRFIPKGGPSLFKKVELFDFANNLVAVGNTNNLGNGMLDVSFPNVCPPPDATTSYIVKSTYTKIDNPNVEIYGTDTVNVIAGQIAATTIVAHSCGGNNTGQITVTPTNGVAPYTFQLNGGLPQPTGIFSNLPAGNYTVNITDAIGCKAVKNITINKSAIIQLSTQVVAPSCFGGGNGSIMLSVSGGLPPFTFSADGGNNFQNDNIFSNLSAGQYNIIIKDNVGCTKDTNIIITQPDQLTFVSNATAATCSGNDGVILVTPNGGTAPYQFTIDGDPSFQNENKFISTVGDHSITVMDNKGCLTDANVQIPLNDTMHLELGNNLTICVGSSVSLQPQTNALTNEFSWTPAAGLNNASIKNPTASPADTTTYTLTAKWGVCQRQDNISINILHKPIADAGSDTTICFKTKAFLKGKALNTSGDVLFSWDPANLVNPANTANTTASPDGTQLFTLTVKDNYGCNFTTTDQVLVKMQPPVPAFAGNDTNAIVGMPHQLFGSGGVSYVWSPANVLDNPFAATPLATIFNNTKFTVEVTDIVGCKGKDDVLIKVYKGPAYYVPNAFSPNGDGLNDIFKPIPVGIKTTEYFRVFNRYGEMIFQTSQFMKGWDGTYQGKKQPAGTYVWMIKGIANDGKVIEMKNTVLLVE